MQPEKTIVDVSNEIRETLKTEEASVRDFVNTLKSAPEEVEGFNKSECIAQAMLALRHVEDARMRIGKVIQYATGGESVYDKK